MLIWVRLRLIESHPSMTRNSPILRSTSTGFNAANIAAGFGNGSIPGIMLPIMLCMAELAIPCEAASSSGARFSAAGGGSLGVTAPDADPGIGIAKGFHMRCMNAIASCAENGALSPSGLLVGSLIAPPECADARGILARYANIVRHDVL